MPQFSNKPSKNTSDIIVWINGSGETVPPYGVVEVTSFNTSTKEYTIGKPSDEGMIWFVNRNVSVANGDKGESYSWSHPQLARLEPATPATPGAAFAPGTPTTPGTGLAPIPGTWDMGPGNSFVLYTNADEAPVGSNLGGVYPGGAGAMNRHNGILLEDVDGAANPLTDPSTGIVRVLVRNASGNLEVTNICLETVYRFTVPDLVAGSFCKIEFLDGEWSFYAVDCEDSGLSTAGCS